MTYFKLASNMGLDVICIVRNSVGFVTTDHWLLIEKIEFVRQSAFI